MALKHYPSLWHPYQTIHNRQLTDKLTDCQDYPQIMFQYFTHLGIHFVICLFEQVQIQVLWLKYSCQILLQF